MNTYLTHSGTGFQYEESDINLKGLLSLISKAEKTSKEIEDNATLLDNITVSLNDENLTLKKLNEAMDIPEIISECLNEISGLASFVSVSGDDGSYYVLFLDKSPWCYTEKEKTLTKDTLLNLYKTILSGTVNNLEIEDLYIANYLYN